MLLRQSFVPLICFLFVATALAFSQAGAQAPTVTWRTPTQNNDATALTDLRGYRIKISSTSGDYSAAQVFPVTSAATTSVSLSSIASALPAGNYYLVMSAYKGDLANPSTVVESVLSNEVFFRRVLLQTQPVGTGSGTITSNGISCGADCSEVVFADVPIELVATPAAGSFFSGWTGAGCTGLVPRCTINISAATQVSATFSRSGVPPIITTQPQSLTVLAGTPVTLMVGVDSNSSTPLQYQWRRGADLVGTNASSLTIPNAVGSDAGSYTVTISNAAGSIISNAALLTVNTPPRFTLHPLAQTVVAGNFVAFTVAIAPDASTPLTYTWKKNGTVVGTNSSSLVIGSASSADAADYQVEVRNAGGTAYSLVAKLTVVTPPRIVSQPSSVAAVVGGSAVFSVGIASDVTQPVTYAWKRGSIAVGTNGPTLTINPVSESSAGSYTVTITNAAGLVTSGAASLSVQGLPTITTQPQPQIRSLGTSVQFTVVANGGVTPYTYQWRKNGIAISGAVGTSYSINAVNAADAANYSVLVRNGNGSGVVESAPAVLTVTAPITISQAGAGSGTVTGGPVNCSVSNCTAQVPTGSSITLTAVPGSTSNFVNWGGVCSGTSPSCTFMVDAAKNVTATFALKVPGAPAGVQLR